MTPALDDIRMELDKAASVVATASRLLAQGRSVDLTALEGKVATACEGIAALPPAEARVLLPVLEDLMGALDRVEEDLKAQHAAVTSHQATIPAPRAAAAYGRNQTRATRGAAPRPADAAAPAPGGKTSPPDPD